MTPVADAADAAESVKALRRTRVAFGAGVGITLLALLVFLGLFTALHRAQSALLASRQVARLSRAAIALAVDRETGVRGFLLSRDPAALEPEEAARPALDTTLRALAAATAGTPDSALVSGVRDAVGQWERGFADPAIAAPAAVGDGGPLMGLAGKTLFDPVRHGLRDLIAREDSLYTRATQRAQAAFWRMVVTVLVSSVLLLAMLAVMRHLILSQILIVDRQRTELREQNAELRIRSREMEDANVELETLTETMQDQAVELEQTNAQLESAAEDLQSQAVELEEKAEALQVTNSDLEHARAAAEAKALEQTALLAALPELIVVLNAQGRYLATPSPNRIPGTPADRLGRLVSEILPRDIAARVVAAVVHAIDAGVPQEMEFSIDLAGERHYYAGQAIRLDADRALFVTQETTDRKRAEHEILARDQRLRAVISASSEVTWDVDLAANTVSWSDALDATFGNSPANLSSDPGRWTTRIHPDDVERVERAVQSPLDGTSAVWSEEYRFQRQDGTYAAVLGRGCVIRDEAGKPAWMVGSMLDLSERQALEMQLRQSRKMDAIGQLAGGVAHDFNNLLTVISSYAAMSMEEMAPDDASREAMQEIATAANHAAALTRQLLMFSRQQVQQLQVVALSDVLQEAERMLRRLLPENIVFTTTLAPESGMIDADPEQLAQIVLNLAVNARDAMPNGGAFSIATSTVQLHREHCVRNACVSPGTYTVLTASDTGMGMTEATLDHLFEPFFTTKPPGMGTGLGLATVYGIVRQSGGQICVSSTEGAGATFEIFFPVKHASREDVPAEAPRSSRGSELVLVVDDNAAVRKVVVTTLSRAGYAIREAANGVEALSVLDTDGVLPALLITDVIMPVMGANELVPEVQRRHPDVRVLLMTGYTRDRLTHAAWSAGVAYIEKPFTGEALLERVRELLDDAFVSASP
jgi:PAS domain S-box-containing protein